MREILQSSVIVVSCLAAAVAFANPGGRATSSGLDYGFATDAFPGFEDFKEEIAPKEKQTWKFWKRVKFNNPRNQFAYAEDMETNGLYRAAASAYDALVREWPACPQAAAAQLHLAESLYRSGDKQSAFDEFEYLLKYYAGLSRYRKIVNIQYAIADELTQEDQSMFGIRLWSNRRNRRRYELLVRRAPGEDFAPEAMLKIAALRFDDDDIVEAVTVCENLAMRYPSSKEASTALYRACQYRMKLVERQEYNAARCVNSRNYMRLTLEKYPNLEGAEDIRTWIAALDKKIEDDAYNRAVFYDTRQRAQQSAISAYEVFMAEFPQSSRFEAVSNRVEAIRGGAAPLRR